MLMPMLSIPLYTIMFLPYFAVKETKPVNFQIILYYSSIVSKKLAYKPVAWNQISNHQHWQTFSAVNPNKLTDQKVRTRNQSIIAHKRFKTIKPPTCEERR